MMRTLQSSFPAFLLLVFLLGAFGCTQFNGTRLEPVLGGNYDLVNLGDKVAGSLAKQSGALLMPNRADQPILVTTLVSNDNFDVSSSFGRSFQQCIVAGFVKRGYEVKEINLRKNILIEAGKGEFMLTRDVQELACRQRGQAIVVGTYTMANRIMYLSVRLVSPCDQTILAIYEDSLYLDENNLRLLGLTMTNGERDEHDPTQPFLPPSPSFLDSLFY